MIKTCTKCGLVGEENLFTKKRNMCKKCTAAYKREEYRRLNLGEKRKEEWKEYQSRPDVRKRIRANKRVYSRTEKAKQYKRAYQKSPKYRKRRNEYHRNKIQTDPNFKIKHNLRRRINDCVTNKSDSSMNLLHCSIDYFREWLEFNFDEYMTWDNYGSYWHIDHIIPCASFDLEDPEQQHLCFCWSNMAPLEKNQNLIKGNKILPDIIEYYVKRQELFLDIVIENDD